MSALKSEKKSMGMVIFILLSLLSPCTMLSMSEGEGTSFSDRVSSPVDFVPGCHRSDLLLIEDEVVHLSGSHEYRKIILSTGSSLFIENAHIELTGDGNLHPSITGDPDTISIINSTIDMISKDGSSLLMNRGGSSKINITVSKDLILENSTIDLLGGDGWSKTGTGAYFDTSLSGEDFTGGDCSFKLFGNEGAGIEIRNSIIELKGGDGSDAPDGESMTHDSFFLSGGYTTGADVSGSVGKGGETSIDIESPGNVVTISNLMITLFGGNGGDAGNGGGILWNGSRSYKHPTSSGGYTSGGWKDGLPYDPGNVSGEVGSGGDSKIMISCSDLHITDLALSGYGGFAGEPGKGGSCISDPGGDPQTVTNTLGGGGGAGFSGGYGGMEGMARYDGGNGGKVTGNVASGGDVIVDLNATRSIWFHTLFLSIEGGGSRVSPTSGKGGGSTKFGLDGGGGGGGGWSSGGGAPAVLLFNNMIGGKSGITDDLNLTRGGSCKYRISTEMLMSDSRTDLIMYPGQGWVLGPVIGESGEVGGSVEYDGGEGGEGNGQGSWNGIESLDSPLPAPVPKHPKDGESITDLSIPFGWSESDQGFFSTTEPPATFRLLGSPSVDDVIQEFDCTGRTAYLEESIDDGIYYWTIRTRSGSRYSTWMEPQSFILDRSPPELQSGPVDSWYPILDPHPVVIFMDNVSGIDPDSTEFRAGLEGDQYSEWDTAILEYLGDGEYWIMPNLPMIEGNWTFWVRATDRSGNGPIIAGPYEIGIDGGGPDISHLDPGGWKGSSFRIDFEAEDSLSGLSDLIWVDIYYEDGQMNLTLDWDIIDYGTYRSKDNIILGEGDYTLVIGLLDNVGNVGRSPPLSIMIDPSSPDLVSFSPADGALINDPDIDPFFRMSDGLSGLAVIGYDLSGPDTNMSISFPEGAGVQEFDLSEPLAEGIYSWKITAEDVTGNKGSFGPFTFIVDLTGPETSVGSLTGDGLSITYIDNWTSCSSMEVKCTIPGPSSMIDVWMDSHEVEEIGTSTMINVSMIGILPGPVCYLYSRGIDSAGNAGPWSEPLRVDDLSIHGSMSVEMYPIFRPDDMVSFNVSFPLGVDPSSLSVLFESDYGGRTVCDLLSVDVIENGSLMKDSDLMVPMKITSGFLPPIDSGSADVVVEFEDPLPGSKRWKSCSIPVVIDSKDPVLILDARDIFTTEKGLISINASDQETGIGGIIVSVDHGPFMIPNIPGAPSLSYRSKGSTLTVNLTYGRETLVSIRVADLAGNYATGDLSMIASREPEAGIKGSPEGGEIVVGETLVLHADCHDPDGENLTFSWMVDGNISGAGENIELHLTEGSHIIVLNCSDGNLFSEDRIAIRVVADVDDSEGNGISLLPIIIAIVIILMISGAMGILIFKRRKGDDEDDDEMDWGDDEDENVLEVRTSKTEDGRGSERCDICLRNIRDGSRKIRCRCGGTFHRGCASNQGECPECGRELMLRTG